MAQRKTLPYIDTEGARITFEGGIIVIEAKEGSVVDLAQAKQQSDAVSKLVTRPTPFLVLLGKMKRQTKEARDFFSSHPQHVAKYTACALVVRNPFAKVLANFYMGINRPPKPIRMFTSREHAIEWLEEYK